MNLKKKLWEIEIALKEENFVKALFLYEEIKKDWSDYEKFLRNHQNLKEIFKLINYIDEMLKEKLENLKLQEKLLKVRKKYTKY